MFTFGLAFRCRPGKCAAALATVALGAGAMLAMTPAAGAATTPAGPAAWSIMPTPSLPNSRLDAVSCTSASACTAVGAKSNSAGNATLAERWNGKVWAVQATPTRAAPRKLF